MITAKRPTLRKAVKTALPEAIKRAFVSIPGFLDAGATLARMRQKLPGVDLKAYADCFKSIEDWQKRRRKVIQEQDALIVAIGPKRNAPSGVTSEILRARQLGKPIYLFNTATGLIEPFTRFVMTVTFPPAESQAAELQQPATKKGDTSC